MEVRIREYFAHHPVFAAMGRQSQMMVTECCLNSIPADSCVAGSDERLRIETRRSCPVEFRVTFQVKVPSSFINKQQTFLLWRHQNDSLLLGTRDIGCFCALVAAP